MPTKRQKKVIVTKHKERGNKFFAQKKYRKALKEYNEAIKLCPRDHTLYSNRSACYTELKQYTAALIDGHKCTQINPDWVKGYYRTGLALFKLGWVQEARKVYVAGMLILSLKYLPFDSAVANP